MDNIVLKKLLGVWRGEGVGEFPTIPTFNYAEDLTFTSNEGDDLLHYEQRTWRIDENGDRIPSHWESGFLVPKRDDTLELINSQNGGRVEILIGMITNDHDALILTFKSKHLANDDRMKATARVFRITDGELTYTMDMATQSVNELTLHLTATLHKVT